MFFAGSLVDPAAYAPYLYALATNGIPSVLIKLPRRGACGTANDDKILLRGLSVVEKRVFGRWIIGGHSKGGEVAARFARKYPGHTGGLLLIGTSPPRDFSLAAASYPVMKIIGSRDGLASQERCEKNRRNLPLDCNWVVIQGGNHSQFGYYGFQPGDSFAEISRWEQQTILLQETLKIFDACQGI